MLAVLALWLGVSLGACQTCTTQLNYGLAVTVLDGPGGPAVCDAMVTARDGAYSETLPSGGSPCVYTGAAERAGTYSIDVVRGGKTKTVDGIRVTAGDCHVAGQAVTITLDP